LRGSTTPQGPTARGHGRRVERAQDLLTATDMALVQIALSVGFQNQSHFTTVFKRFAGQTPQAWRRLMCQADLPRAA
jgi:transcriptional regulator GlxA family with amidase domain